MGRDYRESEDSSSHQETARFAPLGIQNRRQRSQRGGRSCWSGIVRAQGSGTYEATEPMETAICLSARKPWSDLCKAEVLGNGMPA